MRDRRIRERLRRPGIVTLHDGSSFRGVLFDKDDEALVLRQVEHLSHGNEPVVPVDGELVVLFVNVAYIQIL